MKKILLILLFSISITFGQPVKYSGLLEVLAINKSNHELLYRIAYMYYQQELFNACYGLSREAEILNPYDLLNLELQVKVCIKLNLVYKADSLRQLIKTKRTLTEALIKGKNYLPTVSQDSLYLLNIINHKNNIMGEYKMFGGFHGSAYVRLLKIEDNNYKLYYDINLGQSGFSQITEAVLKDGVLNIKEPLYDMGRPLIKYLYLITYKEQLSLLSRNNVEKYVKLLNDNKVEQISLLIFERIELF